MWGLQRKGIGNKHMRSSGLSLKPGNGYQQAHTFLPLNIHSRAYLPVTVYCKNNSLCLAVTRGQGL